MGAPFKFGSEQGFQHLVDLVIQGWEKEDYFVRKKTLKDLYKDAHALNSKFEYSDARKEYSKKELAAYNDKVSYATEINSKEVAQYRHISSEVPDYVEYLKRCDFDPMQAWRLLCREKQEVIESLLVALQRAQKMIDRLNLEIQGIKEGSPATIELIENLKTVINELTAENDELKKELAKRKEEMDKLIELAGIQVVNATGMARVPNNTNPLARVLSYLYCEQEKPKFEVIKNDS